MSATEDGRAGGPAGAPQISPPQSGPGKKPRMSMQLGLALLPLVLFWAIETYLGLKAALIAGCVAAVGEVTWERLKTGRVSFLTLSSNVLVLGLGAISFWMDSGVAFKLQPAVMELGMAAFMASARFKGGEPFLLRNLRDSPMLEPDKREAVLAQPWFIQKVRATDTRLIVATAVHSLALAWAAIWSTSTVWITLKGAYYGVLLAVMIPFMMRPGRR